MTLLGSELVRAAKRAVGRSAKKRILVVAAGIAGLLTTTGTAPAHASTLYYFKNQNSQQCLAIGAASTAGGAGAIQWNCVAGAYEQMWSTDGPYWVGGEAYYRIINHNSGKCLADPASNTNAGVQMIQYGCGSGHEQLWAPDSFDSFRNLASGLVLAVGGASQTPGAPVVQWYPLTSPEQTWCMVTSPSSPC